MHGATSLTPVTMLTLPANDGLAHSVCAAARRAVQAIPLLVKVLSKAMDTSLASDKLEVSVLTRDEATGQVSRACAGGVRGHGAELLSAWSKREWRSAGSVANAATGVWRAVWARPGGAQDLRARRAAAPD